MTDEVTAQVSASTQETVDTAKRLGLTWTLRPATINTIVPLTATYDGDTQPIDMVPLMGPLSIGGRVYGLFVPPAGNFIIGQVDVGTPGLKDRVDSIVSSAAIGAVETVVLTGNTMNFIKNRCYAVKIRGRIITSAANTAVYRVRQTNLTGTELHQMQIVRSNAVGTEFYDETRVAVTSATGSDNFVLTATIAAGTTTMQASAQDVRFMEIWDVGPASDYPNAIAI